MNGITDFITTKIAKTEREHANALAKSSEYTIKASEQRQRAEELEVLLRHLKQWGTEFGADLPATQPFAPSDTTSNHASPTVPVRALVKAALESLRDFSSGDLVSAVQLLNPNAKKASILSELSHCKGRKDVIHFGQDSYRSFLFAKTEDDDNPFDDNPFDDDAPATLPLTEIDEVGGKELNNEPGPDFGRII